MDETNRYSHGIFISYKAEHKHLAGRIYDFFHARGVDPFMDEHSMGLTQDYEIELLREIEKAPYFLCLLTPEGLDELCAPDRFSKMFYKEVRQALDTGSQMMIVTYHLEDIFYLFDTRLPEDLIGMSKVKPYSLDENNATFFHVMNDLMDQLDAKKLHGVINWREYTERNANVRIETREVLERTTASFETRFGKAFMESVLADKPFEGENHIKEIDLSCYAASIIFSPKREHVDRNAYDIGKMFKVFRALLSDPAFTLRLIVNAPDSPAVQDAIDYSRLGNNAFEEHPEGVFLSAYAGIQQLLTEEPFKSAARERRFHLTLSNCVMPFSVFRVVYKRGWEEFNHVKVDLYSLDLDSSVDRLSMLIFEKDDREKYDFFVHQFEFLRKKDMPQTRRRIKENNEKWLRDWEELKAIL